jgi:cytochrome c556
MKLAASPGLSAGLPVLLALALAGPLPAAGASAATTAIGADAGPQTPSGALRPVDPADAEGVIFERQQIMLQLEKDAEALGMIVAGLAPREKLAATARAVADGARESRASFELHAEGGRSKPEVWSNWDDYSRRMQVFETRSEEMAKLAEAGNLNGVIEIMSDAMPCKACHDVYRTPKKRT